MDTIVSKHISLESKNFWASIKPCKSENFGQPKERIEDLPRY